MCLRITLGWNFPTGSRINMGSTLSAHSVDLYFDSLSLARASAFVGLFIYIAQTGSNDGELSNAMELDGRLILTSLHWTA